MGVSRFYQLRTTSTLEAKTQVTALSTRLLTVLGAVRSPARFAHSIMLFGRRSAAALAAAASGGNSAPNAKGSAYLFSSLLIALRLATSHLPQNPTTSSTQV